MIKIKYDMNLMKYISLFESITRTNVDDAFQQDEIVYFIVKEGMAGKAIGKKGINYKKIEGILKKKVRIIENSKDLSKFIENIIYPLKLANIEIEPTIIKLTAVDTKTRGILIGRGGINLRSTETIVKRYFNDLVEIKVI
ncbi:NusA-like transcription termination signal-binding factor [Candidatus Woesearchaeota archaeon]|nr:NusA-like transcription termination signal-binding factor [Candidatus Woesearchaeota archaeon]